MSTKRKEQKSRRATTVMCALSKKRTFYTILAFLLPLSVFAIGMIINKGDRKTIYTVVAIVGCLPACKFAVEMIMIYLQKPISEETYRQIEKHRHGLVCAYELAVSAYEKQSFLDSVTVCGNTVAAYTSREKTDTAFLEKHIQTILRDNGFYVTVKIFRRLPDYLNRLDSMWEHREALEKDIRYVPDPAYAGLTRNERVMHIIYAISL